MDGACTANDAPAAAVGMTAVATTKKRSPSEMDDGGAAAGKRTRKSSYIAESVKAGTRGKRWYEHGEHELDMSTSKQKMFKCNYWEDPAFAWKLEYDGLSRARMAADDNECERLHREFEAWRTACEQNRPDDAAAALRRMGNN